MKERLHRLERLYTPNPTYFVLLVGCVLLTSGCATNHVVEWKAKSHQEFDKANGHDVEVSGRPAYYALLPLTIPFDIATSPIQLGILLAWPAAKMPKPE